MNKTERALNAKRGEWITRDGRTIQIAWGFNAGAYAAGHDSMGGEAAEQASEQFFDMAHDATPEQICRQLMPKYVELVAEKNRRARKGKKSDPSFLEDAAQSDVMRKLNAMIDDTMSEIDGLSKTMPPPTPTNSLVGGWSDESCSHFFKRAGAQMHSIDEDEPEPDSFGDPL